jgi:hypothetical protein
MKRARVTHFSQGKLERREEGTVCVGQFNINVERGLAWRVPLRFKLNQSDGVDDANLSHASLVSDWFSDPVLDVKMS